MCSVMTLLQDVVVLVEVAEIALCRALWCSGSGCRGIAGAGASSRFVTSVVRGVIRGDVSGSRRRGGSRRHGGSNRRGGRMGGGFSTPPVPTMLRATLAAWMLRATSIRCSFECSLLLWRRYACADPSCFCCEPASVELPDRDGTCGSGRAWTASQRRALNCSTLIVGGDGFTRSRAALTPRVSRVIESMVAPPDVVPYRWGAMLKSCG
jgi:hypothetical protein